jgi:hypothetical protein
MVIVIVVAVVTVIAIVAIAVTTILTAVILRCSSNNNSKLKQLVKVNAVLH